MFLRSKRRHEDQISRVSKNLRKKVTTNDEVLSESDEDKLSTHEDENAISDDDEETAQEKRLRLTKLYLADLAKQQDERSGSEEAGTDAIAERLREDALEHAGRLQRHIADEFLAPSSTSIKVLKGHKTPVLVVTVSPDGRFVFSGARDGTVIKWDLLNGRRCGIIKSVNPKVSSSGARGHSKNVFALAVSSDGAFMCSGGHESVVHVWKASSLEHVKEFTGHKGPVSGLVFRKGHRTLYSASHDRSVKLWNLDEMGYVETLFGHQDAILGIDALLRERAVTCGGRDRSVRVWKIVEESQLVFNAYAACGSVECVCLINEDHFVSGGDDGSLSVWSAAKKKPVCTVERAHKCCDDSSCWISAVASLKNTDLIASGSRDGFVRLWKCAPDYKSLTLLHDVPIRGFVNSLCFVPDGSAFVCAVGQEHRLGRWWRDKDAKNAVVVVSLQRKSQ